MYKVVIVSAILLVSLSKSARILGIIPTASYSHQVVFQPIWRELSLRGHQITIITTDPINDPKLTNLTEIDVHDVSYALAKKLLIGKFENDSVNIIKVFIIFIDLMREMAEVQFQHPDIQNLFTNKNEKFDLVMVEGFAPVHLAFSKRFEAPLIIMQSVDGINQIFSQIGNPTHPILNPDVGIGGGSQLNFFDRLLSVSVHTLAHCVDLYYQPMWDADVKKYFGEGYPTTNELLRSSSLYFVNADQILTRIRALNPNIIQIGGGIHLASKKPLPKDLQKYLDDAKEGFIYFSLGSNIKSKDLPSKTTKTLLETFAELPYKVLWKFELDKLQKQPANVYTSKWFPQQDVLRHPNIKLFITQGGLQSIEEALHSHVPMIGVPFFADQPANVKRLVVKGMGLSVDHDTLDKDDFKGKITEVIDNPKYKARVTELANLVIDQPMTGLERAVWWTEYVLRHKGAKHLRSPALDLPTYQYYLLDVIGFCLLVVLIVVYIIVKSFKLIWRFLKYCCCKTKKEKRS